MTMNQIKELAGRAMTLHEKEDYAEAERLFLEALYLIDDKDNQLYQLLVYGLGVNYSLQGNYDGARSCFEEGRVNARKANNVDFEMDMLRELVKTSRATKDYDSAKLLLEEEILYRVQYAPNDRSSLSATWFEKAIIYMEENHPKKSEEALIQALAYAKQADDEEGLAYLLMTMGDFYQKNKQSEQAIQYYEESLQKFKQLDKRLEIAVIESILGG